MKKLAILSLFPLLSQLQGCNEASAESQPDPIYTAVMHESTYNEYNDSTNKSSTVITSLEHYSRELLLRSSEPTQAVNFANESILLIDMGTRNSGGYSVSLESVSDAGDYIRANVVFTLPGDCAVTTEITNPYQFIKIETSKEILVTESIELASC